MTRPRAIVAEFTLPLAHIIGTRLASKLRRRVHPEDLQQAVWRSVFRKRSQRGRFQSREHFARWLSAVARNEVVSLARYLFADLRDLSREASPSSRGARPLDANESPLPHANVKASFNEWQSQLDDRFREVVSRLQRGDSVDEIAEQLDISESTVRRVLKGLGAESPERRLW